jgi:hypothetical protein
MAAYAPVISHNLYLVDPAGRWAGTVGLVESNGAVGLLTGQSTMDGVLRGVDAAWQTANSAG